jgi:adenylyltransferase/sulfurtransferase
MAVQLIDEEFQRYQQQIALSGFGREGQQRLKSSTIAVVGCGGLGCAAMLYLAAAGVGEIVIIDGDRVDVSNLHRQVLFSAIDVGRAKCDSACEKLALQNPYVSLRAVPQALTADNALSLLQGVDLVVDATDNAEARYALDDACGQLALPWVYASIGGHAAQLSLFHPDGHSYRDLFPPGPEAHPQPSCSQQGVLGPLPGIVGTMQALEAVKEVAGIGSSLKGKLMVIDTITWHSSLYTFDNVLEHSHDIKTEELYELMATPDQVMLIDVREPAEHASGNIGGVCIPLTQFSQRLKELPLDKTVVVYCQSGTRSAAAARIALHAGLHNVRSLHGGIGSQTVSNVNKC